MKFSLILLLLLHILKVIVKTLRFSINAAFIQFSFFTILFGNKIFFINDRIELNKKGITFNRSNVNYFNCNRINMIQSDEILIN